MEEPKTKTYATVAGENRTAQQLEDMAYATTSKAGDAYCHAQAICEDVHTLVLTVTASPHDSPYRRCYRHRHQYKCTRLIYTTV